MTETSYVSCVGSDEVFDWVKETYGDDEGAFEVDLGYFFKRDDSDKVYKVKTAELGRQFSAQYPEYDVIKRCVMMNYFGDETNDRVTKMWISVRG